MGVFSLTKNQIEKFVKELEKEGKITEKEGRKLIVDLVKEADKKQKEIRRTQLKNWDLVSGRCEIK